MLRNALKSIVLALLILLSLIACSSVTPAGLIAASRLDPLDSDANQIAIAVGVPNGLQLSDGDAQFQISFQSAAQAIVQTVPLRIRYATSTGPAPDDESQTVYVADFSPENAAIITSAQSRIKALKAAGVDGKGSISISVVGGCVASKPPPELPVSTWLRTKPDRAFVRLTRLRNMLHHLPASQSQEFMDNLRVCPPTTGSTT
ncbi:MAG: hypothetical protein AAF280_09915 [Pseudomonadota bacterium]